MKLLQKLGNPALLNWLLPAYLFLLPYQARLILTTFSAAVPRYGDLSIYATDVLFWVLAVVWIAHMHCVKNKAHPEWRRLRVPMLFVLALFVYVGGALLWTPDMLVGRDVFYRLLQAGMLGMMIASGVVEQRRLLIALAASGALQGAVAVQQFFAQGIAASTLLGMSAQAPRDLGVSVIEYADERWLRAYGSLPHPNMLGAFCGAAMLAASTLFWRGYQTLSRNDVVIGWLTFILSYFGLLFSFSRSAWLATALAGAVYVAVELIACDRMNKKYFAIAFGKLAAVCALFLIFFSASFGPLWWSRTTGEGRLAQKSTTDREALATQATALADQHPWLGYGVGSYLPALVKQYPDQPLYDYQPVHRVWSLLQVEYGYVGLAIVAGMIIAAFVTLYRFKLWSWAPMLVFLLVGSSFEHFWYTLPFGLLLMATLVTWPLAKTAETC